MTTPRRRDWSVLSCWALCLLCAVLFVLAVGYGRSVLCATSPDGYSYCSQGATR